MTPDPYVVDRISSKLLEATTGNLGPFGTKRPYQFGSAWIHCIPEFRPHPRGVSLRGPRFLAY